MSLSLTSEAAAFGGTSTWVDLDGPTHVVELGPETSQPTFVLLHGLGGSYLDWSLLAPRLAPVGRVLVLDLPAFGLSPTSGRSASVDDDVQLVRRLVADHTSGPVVLVGNSRGGMLSVLAAPGLAERLAGVVLIGPALPAPGIRPDSRALVEVFPAALPVVGPCFVSLGRRRVPPAGHVDTLVRYCFPEPGRAPEAYVAAVTRMLESREPDAERDRAAARAARTVVGWFVRHRRYDAALDRVGVPVLHVHGTRDRLVPVAAARRALARRPHWRGVILEDVGHTPQLEVPDLVADAIHAWVASEVTVS